MNGVLLAERTIFFELQSFGIVLFIFHIVVISVFTFGTFERNFGSVYSSHLKKTPYKKITPLHIGVFIEFNTFFFPCQ